MPSRTKKKKFFTKKAKKRQGVLRIDLDKMTSKQIAKYEDSLDVLNKIRHGQSLRQASKQVGISAQTVRRYVGSTLELQNHKWTAKQSDRLLRKLVIYKKGNQVWVTVRGIRQARIVAQYHSAIGRLSKDESALQPFKKIKIKDAKGKFHRLETDSKNIFAILERQEDAEFYSIYARR